MSFVVVGGGASKWSQVLIDTDKDMLAFGFTNLKELSLASKPGELITHDGDSGILKGIPLGVFGTELMTKGKTYPPVWGYADSGEMGWTAISKVIQGSDDSCGVAGVFYNAAVGQVMGYAGGNAHSAFRFQHINIPADSIITSANIRFISKSNRAVQTVNMIIKAEASDSPLTYGAAEDFTLRTYRSIYVYYTMDVSWAAGSPYYSVDITSIIRDLYATYGPYIDGNIAIEIINNGTVATNYQVAESFESEPLAAAVLAIYYGVG
jgi:hypothetical protein